MPTSDTHIRVSPPPLFHITYKDKHHEEFKLCRMRCCRLGRRRELQSVRRSHDSAFAQPPTCNTRQQRQLRSMERARKPEERSRSLRARARYYQLLHARYCWYWCNRRLHHWMGCDETRQTRAVAVWRARDG